MSQVRADEPLAPDAPDAPVAACAVAAREEDVAARAGAGAAAVRATDTVAGAEETAASLAVALAAASPVPSSPVPSSSAPMTYRLRMNLRRPGGMPMSTLPVTAPCLIAKPVCCPVALGPPCDYSIIYTRAKVSAAIVSFIPI